MATCKGKQRAIFIALLAVTLTASPLLAATIVGSLHDFSDGGSSGFSGGTLYNDGFGTAVDEVCVFCHTPHGASTNIPGMGSGPLWNRTNSPPAGYTYTPYSSPTLNATVSATPTGTSAMCMSCHDGVTSIAINTLLNPPGEYPIYWVDTPFAEGRVGDIYNPGFIGYYGPNLGDTYVGSGNFTIDLSNDHPVSFDWPTGLDTGLRDPTLVAPALRLFGAGRRVECATCHQVHDPTNVPFLAMANNGSAMCLECHIK